jgi:thiol-disulfide isomerase/thioredoxin
MKPESARGKQGVDAPELEGAVAWLNTDRALTLQSLRGCVVVLDFWTYCCINCMHVIPTLREIEMRFADQPVVVIGVHSGKFNAERDPARIREAIGRYGVDHPVAVDDDMHIWSAYAIRSWPTLVVVNPSGKIAAVAPGEPELETLDAFIRSELEIAKKAGTLAKRAPAIADADHPDTGRISHEPLLYPGKARVMPNGQIAISDSGHHRVLMCDAKGQVQMVAGSGIRGLSDGVGDAAAFDDPQGVCWHDGALLVADTRNHAIRRIDPVTAEVTTVAGNGQLGPPNGPAGRVGATSVALRSPWDVCSVGDAIYVAMAGSHQIWRYWPATAEIEVYAGSGTEALLDGPVITSSWAQPSGLSERDGVLYVADSESSAVRAVNLETNEVRTLTGQGLFDFGDGEGDADAVLLQHCLGVAATADGVLIADTYNGKIKRWVADGDHAGEITTLLDGLSEPGSVSVTEDGVWIVADTNAHRILGVREGAIAELTIRGMPRSQRGAIIGKNSERSPTSSVRGWFTNLLKLPEGVGLAPGDARVWLDLATPSGTALAPGAPMSIDVEVSRRSDLLLVPHQKMSVDANGGRLQRLAFDVRVTKLPSPVVEAELVVKIEYIACHEDDTRHCSPERIDVRVPVRLMDQGVGEIAFALDLKSIQD